MELIPLSSETLEALLARPEAFFTPGENTADEEAILLEVARNALHYQRETGAVPPWAGYFYRAEKNTGPLLGTCSFKGNPTPEGQVEIAYFTLPTQQGKGVATAMAGALCEVAKEHGAARIIAHTLPEESPSTSVLKKCGFEFGGEIEHPEDGLVWLWVLGNG